MPNQIIKEAPCHKCAQKREIDYILAMCIFGQIDVHNWTKKLYYTDNFQSFVTKISCSKVFKNAESAFLFLQ
jgi:hypothetical protein